METSGVVLRDGETVKIYEIRGMKVMLDSDLAKLYGVETKVLNQAVARNKERFPRDFMFVLSDKEYESLRSQIVTANSGMRRFSPYAFTEHGILMLSSVLKSEKAVKVNIQIMRAFVAIRESLANYKQLKRQLDEIEEKYDENFKYVFQAINQMLELEEDEEKAKIGFKY